MTHHDDPLGDHIRDALGLVVGFCAPHAKQRFDQELANAGYQIVSATETRGSYVVSWNQPDSPAT